MLRGKRGYLRYLADRLPVVDENLYAWAKYTNHVNLLSSYPGEKFPMEKGRHEAGLLWHAISAGSLPKAATVYFAGKNVGRAFECRLDFLQPAVRDRIRIVVLPHPSGPSRWWNTVENRAAALEFLRDEGVRLVRGSERAQIASE